MLPRLRRALPILGVVAVTAALASLDVVPPGSAWFQGHPMTASAVSSVLTFVALGLLLASLLKERDARRIRKVSTVAYRSLAQHANDVGRHLLAPLNGADLYALAIPGAGREDAQVARARLDSLGLATSFDETSGSWRHAGPVSHDATLRALLGDEQHVRDAYRTTAASRRRLQEATALWAPVMLTSRQFAEHLGDARVLTDAIEVLQEQLRRGGCLGPTTGGWVPDAGWVAAVSAQFWLTIECYEDVRDTFAALAALPSDSFVDRLHA